MSLYDKLKNNIIAGNTGNDISSLNTNKNNTTKNIDTNNNFLKTMAFNKVNIDNNIDKNLKMSSVFGALSGDYNPNKWESYLDYGVNLNRYSTEEELNKARAENQSAFEQLGNSAVQASGEIVLGTIAGFADMYDLIVNLTAEKGEDDYSNVVSRWAEDSKEYIRENLPIYRKDPNKEFDFSDFGWYISNIPSLATSLSLLIPSTAITKGIGLIGRAGKAASVANKLNKISKAGKAAETVEKVNTVKKAWDIAGKTGSWSSLGYSVGKLAKKLKLTNNPAVLGKQLNAFGELATTSAISRTMENYIESRQVFDETYESNLNRLNSMSDKERNDFIKNNPNFAGKTNEEIARYISSVSADTTFANDYWMLALDMAQYKAISGMFKGIKNEPSSARLRIANRNQAKIDAGADIATLQKNNFINRQIDNVIYGIKHPLSSISALQISEGFEEYFQGIQTEKGKEVSEIFFDIDYERKQLSDYLTDLSLYEQGFWGALGGIAFQKGGVAFNKYYNKALNKYQLKKGKITEEEYNLRNLSREKQRLAEINNRSIIFKDLSDKLDIINQGYNPFNVIDTEYTGTELNKKYKHIDNDFEKDVIKESLLNEYISNMTINAIEHGNYDLLESYINDPTFKEYLNKQGLDINTDDRTFYQAVNDRMSIVNEEYTNALRNVFKNINVTDENVAKQVARTIARNKLDLNDTKVNLDNISSNYDNTDTSNMLYENKINLQLIQYKVNSIINKINELKNIKGTKLEQHINNKKIESLNKELQKLYDDIKLRSEIETIFDGNNNIPLKDILELDNYDNIDDALTAGIENAFINLNNIVTIEPNNDIKELIERKVVLEDRYKTLEDNINEYNNNPQELYNEIEEQSSIYNILKFADYTNQIKEYLNKQNTLKELNIAQENIINNNIPELEEAINALKIGSGNTTEYIKNINDIIKNREEEIKTKEKEDAKITVDGVELNEEEAKEIDNIIQEVEEQVEDIIEPIEQQTKPLNNIEKDTKLNIYDNEAVVADIEQETRNNISTFNPNDNIYVEEVEDTISTDETVNETIALEDKRIFDQDSLKVDLKDKSIKVFREEKQRLSDIYKNSGAEAVYQEYVNILKEYINGKIKTNNIPIDTYIANAINNTFNLAYKVSKISPNEYADFINAMCKYLNINDNTANINALANKADIEKEAQLTNIDINIDNIIKDILDEYIKKHNIVKGRKYTTIDIVSLFNYLEKDNNIFINDIKKILFEMKNFIANGKANGYKFKNIIDFNELINKSDEYLKTVIINKSKGDYISDYMHISPSNNKSNDFIEKIKNIEYDDLLIVNYTNNDKNSISFKLNGTEIGFIATVVPDKTGTGYQLKKTQSRIKWIYNIDGTNINSNMDNTIYELINNISDFISIVDEIENNPKAPITEEYLKTNYNNIYNTYVNAVNKSLFIKNTFKGDDYNINNFINDLKGVLLYEQKEITKDNIIKSYNSWKRKQFINFKHTAEIQKELDSGKVVKVKVKGLNKTLLIEENERGISDLKPYIKPKENPVVFVKREGGILQFVDEYGNTYNNSVNFDLGSGGILITHENNNPFIASFTSANPVNTNNKLKSELTNEIAGLINSYYSADNSISFNELANRLSLLISNKDSVFSGLRCFVKNNNIIITHNNKTSDGFMIIHANDKKDISKKGLISKFNNKTNKWVRVNIRDMINRDASANKLAEEFVNNLVFNRTFFTINNSKNINNTDNPYFQKVNGKFVIKLNNTTYSYENFSDFVVSENAFNTNQGISKNGTFFEETEGLDELYVSVDSLNITEKELKDTTATPYQVILNSKGTINIKELFAATSEQLRNKIDILLGNKNIDGYELIPIIDSSIGYDPNKNVYAYTSGNNIFLGKKISSIIGHNAVTANDVNNLMRIIIHENLHKKFNQTNVFKRNNIITELNNTYEDFINKLTEDYNNLNNTEFTDKDRRIIKLLYEQFTGNGTYSKESYYKSFEKENYDEETKRAVFAEEWLVESLTQSSLIDYLSKIDYTGDKFDFNTNAERKSVWQKIIEILLKLFGRNIDNVKENSILAKHYSLLSDEININTINNNNDINTEIENNKIDTTDATITEIDETLNKEEINEDDLDKNDINEEEVLITDEAIEVEETAEFAETAETDNNYSPVEEEVDDNYSDFNLFDDDITIDDITANNDTADDILDTDIDLFAQKENLDVDSFENDIEVISNNDTVNNIGLTPINNIPDFIASQPVENMAEIASMVDDNRFKFLCNI